MKAQIQYQYELVGYTNIVNAYENDIIIEKPLLILN